MKALKITLTLVAFALLTMSGVISEELVVEKESTSKNYSPKDLLALDKKKLKIEAG